MQIKNQKSKIKNVFRNGYVMLLTTIIFMMVSLIIIFGLSTPIIKLIYASRDIWSAKKSYYLAEAGAEDVLYRLKDSVLGSQIVSPEIITLDGYSAVSQISSDVNGRTITTLSDQNGYKKTIETKVTQGSGVSFTYGVQVGQGGIYFGSSGKISGNVLSGGNIVSNNSAASISGSAIVANSPSLVADQTNDSPSTPPNQITFGDAAATQYIAQSFQVSSTSPITQISLYIKKFGAPTSDLKVKIVKNSGSAPSGVAGDVISSAVISASLVTASFDWVEVVLSPNPSLVVGTTYWIVIDGSNGSASKNYIIGANLDSSYSLGTSKKGVLGGTWGASTGYDTYFRIFLGGFFGKIIGVNEGNKLHIGTTASDMAWAHDMSYVSVTGPLRCQTELLNNKACDQSFPDPSGVPYPVSDGNIAQWKADATAGGVINGSYTLGTGSASLGPKKIIGDLHISSATLNITGTLYVTGNIIVDGTGVIKLASSYGTNGGIIVTDGYVSVEGSGSITNSGQTGSYFLVVTTSTCAGGSTCGGKYAISVTGGGGAVVMNAQKGTIYLTGSVDISEATANLLYINGNITVTYKTGVASTNFTSGPSGGFNISSWKELQ